MSDALSGIMKFIQPAIQGTGVIGNLISGQRNAGVQQEAINRQKQLDQLASNPSQLAARIRALQQPLSQGLLSGVGNDVQGYLAERGLSQSPAIQTQILAQALGPYQLQEQQLAQNAVLAPFEVGNNVPPSTLLAPGADTSGFWANFNKDTAGQPKPINAGDPTYMPSADWPIQQPTGPNGVPGTAPGTDTQQYPTTFDYGLTF